MEVTLRTAEEFHAENVTIEIRTTAEEVRTDPGTLGKLAGQEDRIADLEAKLAASQALAEDRAAQVASAEQCRAELKRRAHVIKRLEAELERRTVERDDREEARAELERKLANQREATRVEARRADQNKGWAERAEKALEALEDTRNRILADERTLRDTTAQLQSVREILGATAVGRARDEIVTSKGAVLADAIGNALRCLDKV